MKLIGCVASLAMNHIRWFGIILMYGLPFWLFWYGVAYGAGGPALLAPLGLIAACGLVLTVVTSAGMRMIFRSGILQKRKVLATLWIAVSFIWTAIFYTTLKISVNDLISTNTSIFLVTLAALCLLLPYEVRRRIIWRQIRRQHNNIINLQQKVMIASNGVDARVLLDGLRQTQSAFIRSRASGCRHLAELSEILVAMSDPRYNSRIPLRMALQIAQRKIDSSKTYSNVANVRWPDLDCIPEHWLAAPRLIIDLLTFVIDYCLFYTGRASIYISVEVKSSLVLLIKTDTRTKDRWFVLPKGSRAECSKMTLVGSLNESCDYCALNVTHGENGAMLFGLVFQDNELRLPWAWERIERELAGNPSCISSDNTNDGATRVYRDEKFIIKVERFGVASSKPLSLAEEREILLHLKNVPGVPALVDYQIRKSYAVLITVSVNGIPLNQAFPNKEVSQSRWFRTVAELTHLLQRIHRRGVMHRDLRPENVLCEADDRVWLIDYDQALFARRNSQTNWHAEISEGVPPAVSFDEFLTRMGWTERYVSATREIRVAWEMAARSNASSPGKAIAYYSWHFGPLGFEGEREWLERWDLLESVVRRMAPGSRVLELGCNLGLLGTYCALYGAREVIGVDIEQDVLDAADKFSRSAGVSVQRRRGNLSNVDFVKSLMVESGYDVIFALSVLHWIENKAAVTELISQTSVLVYEGHNSSMEEIAFLKGIGFERVTLLGYTERIRGVYVAEKIRSGELSTRGV